jgi:hypothetical protein
MSVSAGAFLQDLGVINGCLIMDVKKGGSGHMLKRSLRFQNTETHGG